MARRKNLACPVCRRVLLDDCTQCTGVQMVCPGCGYKIFADIDDAGRMRINVEPQAQQTERVQQTTYRH